MTFSFFIDPRYPIELLISHQIIAIALNSIHAQYPSPVNHTHFKYTVHQATIAWPIVPSAPKNRYSRCGPEQSSGARQPILQELEKKNTHPRVHKAPFKKNGTTKKTQALHSHCYCYRGTTSTVSWRHSAGKRTHLLLALSHVITDHASLSRWSTFLLLT